VKPSKRYRLYSENTATDGANRLANT